MSRRSSSPLAPPPPPILGDEREEQAEEEEEEAEDEETFPEASAAMADAEEAPISMESVVMPRKVLSRKSSMKSCRRCSRSFSSSVILARPNREIRDDREGRGGEEEEEKG